MRLGDITISGPITIVQCTIQKILVIICEKPYRYLKNIKS